MYKCKWLGECNIISQYSLSVCGMFSHAPSDGVSIPLPDQAQPVPATEDTAGRQESAKGQLTVNSYVLHVYTA